MLPVLNQIKIKLKQTTGRNELGKRLSALRAARLSKFAVTKSRASEKAEIVIDLAEYFFETSWVTTDIQRQFLQIFSFNKFSV